MIYLALCDPSLPPAVPMVMGGGEGVLGCSPNGRALLNFTPLFLLYMCYTLCVLLSRYAVEVTSLMWTPEIKDTS